MYKVWDCPVYILPFAYLGFLVLFFFIVNLVWSLLKTLRVKLASFCDSKYLVKKFGPWALVTGCTDGIGKAYAFELAKKGVNVVLVSRSQEKLENTAREIESKFSVQTKIIAVDFSLGLKAVEIVKEELGELQINILINNVGKCYDYPMYLTEVSEKDLVDIITINVGAVTLMCRAFIDDMKKRGRGAIVNVSSGADMHPCPFLTVYGATKAYIKSFTEALRYEYKGHGLTIQHLYPMMVATKMSSFFHKGVNENKFFVASPEQYAKYAVATLGKMDNSTGFWTHGIQAFIMSMMPVWIRMVSTGRMSRIVREDYIGENNYNENKTSQLELDKKKTT